MRKKKTAMEQTKDLIAKIEKQKEVCAAERDKLRNLVSDLNDIVESMDQANEDLEDAIRKLEDAVDTMSAYQ